MCVRRKNEKKNEIPPHPAAPKTHYEIHSSPATATTSRRRATKHVPRVSPCSPAFIDPGFVEIGHVQLSQSVKTTNNVTHSMHTDRQTGRQTNLIMPPCVHPGMKRLFCPIGKKRPHFGETLAATLLIAPLVMRPSLGRFAPLALPHY